MERINKTIMNKKPFIFLIVMLILILSGCIKETYNMKKFSDSIKYSPTFSLSAVTGDITFSDIVKPGDTVKFDDKKFVSIIFRKDAVINLKLKDYYDLSNMVSFSRGYKIGELKIDDFQASIPITLSTIFPALINGTTMDIPSFSTDLGEKSFTVFSNFQNATFSSGTLKLSVKNNLLAPLQNIEITLFNSTGHSQIGNKITIPYVAVGATQSDSIDLAGKYVTNSIVARIKVGSPGASSVLIDLNSTVQVSLSTKNLIIQSGRIILPTQAISSLSGVDIIPFDPGSNIEIEELKVLIGTIGYHLVTTDSISGSFAFSLPKALRNGIQLKDTIRINGGTNPPGSISLDNTIVDLTGDASQKFNRIPINYTISVNSKEKFVNFKKDDSIHININMLNPDFDYVKGYFGQMSKQIDPDVLDTGLEEALGHITGQFHISNPSIKLKYRNSFGIPIEVTLNAVGKKNAQTVNLGLAPFTISYPTTLTIRDKNDSLIINKNNSSLPDLISLPPSVITFSGSAKMNPAGGGPVRNNFVFGNSRFLGNLEVEVPLQLWIKNLQFADTVDNFLKLKSTDSSKVKPSDFDSLRINFVAENGFPFGVSVKLMLYDSLKKVVLNTIDATSLLLPAPVDANGKSTGKTESTTTIRFNKDFFDAASSANKMIFMLTLNTSGNGTTVVKIYSDYSLSYKASVMAKPNIKL